MKKIIIGLSTVFGIYLGMNFINTPILAEEINEELIVIESKESSQNEDEDFSELGGELKNAQNEEEQDIYEDEISPSTDQSCNLDFPEEIEDKGDFLDSKNEENLNDDVSNIIEEPKNGWVENKYYINNILQTGKTFVSEENSYYYFDWKTGEKKIGLIDGNFYSYDTGKLCYGWVTDDRGYQYFFDPNTGEMSVGITKIPALYNNGIEETYYFNSKGIKSTGQVKDKNGYYYFFDPHRNGALARGITHIPEEYNYGYGKKVYYNSNGIMCTGQVKNTQGYYYFFQNLPGLKRGEMAIGITHIPEEYNYGYGKKVYYNSNGIMCTGQVKNTQGHYYFFQNLPGLKRGEMAIGITHIPEEYNYGYEKKVYYNSNGIMCTGQVKNTQGYYYFFQNLPGLKRGEMAIGITHIPEEYNYGYGKKVYYNSNGIMCTGQVKNTQGYYYFFQNLPGLKRGEMAVGMTIIPVEYNYGVEKVAYYELDGRMFIGTKNVGKITIKTNSTGSIISTKINGLPYYAQNDELWANTVIGGYIFSETGCAPTVITSIVNYYLNANLTPYQIGLELNRLGYFNTDVLAGTSSDCWNWVSSNYGFNVKNNLGFNDIVNALKTGKLVAGAVGPGTFVNAGYTHEILLSGINELGQTYVYDPLHSERNGWYYISDIWNQRSTAWEDNLNGGPFYAM